jgi:hypothetical protein
MFGKRRKKIAKAQPGKDPHKELVDDLVARLSAYSVKSAPTSPRTWGRRR